MTKKKKSKKIVWPRHAVYLYPPTVVLTKKRQDSKVKLVQRVLPRLYPDGTDRITIEAARRRVVADPFVKTECKRLGIAPPSRAVIARALGRWR